MERRARWSLCLVVLSFTVAAQELPSQANDLSLSDEQKKPMYEGRASLDPQVNALVAACGPVEVVVDWAAYVDVNKARGPLAPKHMWTYVKRCGEAVEALREACQHPRQQVVRRVTFLKCRFMADLRAPSGADPGAWEPLVAAKELYVDFNDTANSVHDTMAAFLAATYPPSSEPNFLDETPEQHRAIESQLSFLNRELKATNAMCGSKLTAIIDYEGIQDGKPKNPNAKSGSRVGAVERVDSMVSEYFSRCKGAIRQLAAFCDEDDATKAFVQKKLTDFQCRYEATREGFGDSNAKCPMKVERGGLVATCTWYQTSDWHGPMAKALGIDDPFKPKPGDEADDPAPDDTGRSPTTRPDRGPAATSTKTPAKERCTPASCVEELGPRGVCKFGKCVMGKKVRGDACKSFQECGNNMSCVHGKCG